MKEKIYTFVRKAIKGAANVSSETTSIFSLYQPKTPEALLKSEKKK